MFSEPDTGPLCPRLLGRGGGDRGRPEPEGSHVHLGVDPDPAAVSQAFWHACAGGLRRAAEQLLARRRRPGARRSTPLPVWVPGKRTCSPGCAIMARSRPTQTNSAAKSGAVRGERGLAADAGLGCYDEGHKELADAVSLEVDGDRHPGSSALLDRVDGNVDVGADGTVDAAHAPAARRIDVGDLGGDGAFDETHPAGVDKPPTRLGRAASLEVTARHVGLPLAEAGRVRHIVEHLPGWAGDVDGGGQRADRKSVAANLMRLSRAVACP